MSDVQYWPVHTDYSGHLYFKVRDAWTKIGRAPVYNGARLHPAHVDDHNHLCYRFQGVWQRSGGAVAVFKEEPLALHCDVHGDIYSFSNGHYLGLSPVPTV